MSRYRALVDKYWGAWKRGNYKAAIPAEPVQTEPRQAHVDWPAPTTVPATGLWLRTNWLAGVQLSLATTVGSTGEQFSAHVKAEMAKWAQVGKAGGVKLQ